MPFAKRIYSFILFLMITLGMQANATDLPDFTQLVEQYSKAVVNISTKHNGELEKSAPYDFSGGKSDMFNELLRRFPDIQGGLPNDKDTSSLGSGFIVSEDGYIVTNHHVIIDADEIIVKLNDRRELVAKLIGSDKRSDVALLKVEANNLPVLETGSSKALKVGEWVIAIGSPFGFDHSVTAGIVSAKGRSLPSENYVPFIQTDVAINPGNSGGPLFNMKGEVVGINSQIISRTGGFMGVSFAIPIDVAKRVVAQLKKEGRVSRGWLGVYIQEINRDLALAFGLDTPKGALIVEVIKEGPAIGILEQGDIVLEFDGKVIERDSILPVIVGSTEIDKSVEVKVRRNGSTKTLRLKVAELPSSEDLERKPEKKFKKAKQYTPILGMEVVELNEAAKETLGIEGGVLVKHVKGNAARKAGVTPGDVLIKLDGKKLLTFQSIKTVIANLELGKSYPLLVLRNGDNKFLALKIEAKQ